MKGSRYIIRIDIQRGKAIAEILVRKFWSCDMPEDILPEVEKGSREHLNFITFTLISNRGVDADKLWFFARKAFNDEQKKYIYFPTEVAKTPFEKFFKDLNSSNLTGRYGISNAKAWYILAQTICNRWEGEILNFLSEFKYDAEAILVHMRKNGKNFPVIKGDKISSLWFRMLRDNVGINFENLDKISIPVDRHIVISTLSFGLIDLSNMNKLKRKQDVIKVVQDIWFNCVADLFINGRRAVSLDLDKGLWLLSRDRCSKRDITSTGCPNFTSQNCPLNFYCSKTAINRYILDMFRA